ncbi:MAG: hypothetical protein IKE22_10205 [Atopobiaceae bacterium]|nr:hypothetical protein [Atopobiaceae bacterium]
MVKEKHRTPLRIVCTLLLAITAPLELACAAPSLSPAQQEEDVEHSAAFSTRLITWAAQRPITPLAVTTHELADPWFHDYVTSRIYVVTLPAHDPLIFGPWFAEDDYDATEAPDDGSIVQWDDGYLITHYWSDYGQAIRTLLPGDYVTINGVTVQIEGVFDYPRDAILAEVLEATGWDAIVFQTCEPDTNLNRIAYGYIV